MTYIHVMSTITIPAWTIADRMTKARKSAGLSQQDLAEACGVHYNTISAWESESRPVKRGQLVAWAMRCGVPIEWLENGTPPEGGGADQHVDEFKHTRLAA